MKWTSYSALRRWCYVWLFKLHGTAQMLMFPLFLLQWCHAAGQLWMRKYVVRLLLQRWSGGEGVHPPGHRQRPHSTTGSVSLLLEQKLQCSVSHTLTSVFVVSWFYYHIFRIVVWILIILADMFFLCLLYFIAISWQITWCFYRWLIYFIKHLTKTERRLIVSGLCSHWQEVWGHTRATRNAPCLDFTVLSQFLWLYYSGEQCDDLVLVGCWLCPLSLSSLFLMRGLTCWNWSSALRHESYCTEPPGGREEEGGGNGCSHSIFKQLKDTCD